MVTKYVVRITNPVTGCSCYLDGYLCGDHVLPLFVRSAPPGTSFRKAHAAAEELRRLFPIVKVVGVYE